MVVNYHGKKFYNIVPRGHFMIKYAPFLALILPDTHFEQCQSQILATEIMCHCWKFSFFEIFIKKNYKTLETHRKILIFFLLLMKNSNFFLFQIFQQTIGQNGENQWHQDFLHPGTNSIKLFQNHSRLIYTSVFTGQFWIELVRFREYNYFYFS